MSLVTWSPAIGITAVWRIAPSVKIAMSVVPPPMSNEQHAELLLVGGQHRVARGELLEDDVLDLQVAALDALGDVLRRADRPRDQVHLGLQPDAGHADRVVDALLVVDQELLGQHVQDPLIGRDRDRLGRLDHALDVLGLDVAFPDRDDAVAVQALDVGAGDPGEHRADLDAGHALGLADRAADGVDRGVDVDHDPAS